MINNQRSGFVLIEAIAAIVVVSVCLTLIAQALLSNFRTGLRFQEGIRSLIATENRLSLLLATSGTADQFLTTLVPLDKPYDHFSVRSKVRKIDDHLKEVELTLSWPTANSERYLSVTTIIYNPDDVKIRTYAL